MALSRGRSKDFNTNVWPGFVDAMTSLLLVLMFVLTIFMVVQFVLKETISGQEDELDNLTGQVQQLADALGLERAKSSQLEGQVGTLTTDLATRTADLADSRALITALQSERDAQAAALVDAQNKITGFEAQVAGLLAERTDLRTQVSGLESDNARMLTEAEALNLALAQARSETDAAAEAARLAAARREAIEALLADLQAKDAQSQTRISELEAAQLADAAAAEALRQRLETSSAELTAMTLSLEQQRREAEETLTLLAAAQAAQAELEAARENQMTDAERQAALLAVANQRLSEEEALSAESQREVAALNENVQALRAQIGTLQALLDEAKAADAASQVQISNLGSDLNQALARVAMETNRRLELEEAERKRLEDEAKELANYRSDFFGRLRQIVDGQAGVQIVGDRFVFSSEVLFPTGSATLSAQGETEIAKVAGILRQIAENIPPEINWIIRVDGHTDNSPLSGTGEFKDNWELSQARALSVVRYMVENEGIDPMHLSANGFGEFQPLDPADTEAARAQNRRIELKLTER